MACPVDDLVPRRPEHVPQLHLDLETPRQEGPRAWAQYLTLRSIQGLVGHLPAVLRRAVVAGLARLCKTLDRRRTQAGRDYLRAALPGLAEREVEDLVLASWRHLSGVAMDFEGLGRRLMGRRLGEHFTIETCPGLNELRDPPRACLFVTAHLGNWEALGPPLQALGFTPLYAVSKLPANGPLARHLRRTRETMGGGLIDPEGSMRSIPLVVGARGSVIMMLDHRPRGRFPNATFFGRPAACYVSAAVLMRRMKVPIVFVTCYKRPEPYRFRLVFSRVLMPEEYARLGTEEVTNVVNRELEKMILAQPDQYFWLHKRFKLRGTLRPHRAPAGEPGDLSELRELAHAPGSSSAGGASDPPPQDTPGSPARNRSSPNRPAGHRI